MLCIARRVYTGTAVLLGLLMAGSGTLDAATGQHVVPQAEIQKAIVDSAQAREADLARLDQFFSSAPVVKAFDGAGMDYKKVRSTVAFLDSQELAQLAARADKVQSDFAAGALTTEQLTYIVIALATAVLILIIIEA